MTRVANYRRFESLQIGRFLAALSVVLLHVNDGLAAAHRFGASVPLAFTWGKIGVDFFFVLSGFIITLTLRREPTPGNFAWHRAVRIYPAFWLAFLPAWIMAMLLAKHLHSAVPTDWSTLLPAALLLPQNASGATPVIGVAWSLHHEVLFYAVALLWTWRRAAGLVIGTTLLLGSFVPDPGFPAGFLFSPLHWEFVLGILAATQFQRFTLAAARATAWSAGAAIVVAAACYLALPDRAEIHVLLFGTLFALMIAALARIETEPGFVLSRPLRHAARLGDSSYTLYLWHVLIAAPALMAIFKLIPGAPAGAIALVGLVLAAACVVIADFIYLRIENPITKLLAFRGRTARVRPGLAP